MTGYTALTLILVEAVADSAEVAVIVVLVASVPEELAFVGCVGMDGNEALTVDDDAAEDEAVMFDDEEAIEADPAVVCALSWARLIAAEATRNEA